MNLVIISSPNKIKDEHFILNELFRNGMEIFHLRKPDWTIDEMERLISGIEKKFHNKIVIHSHYNLCKKYSLRGIHFTGKTKAFSGRYSDWKVQKSISAHSIQEVAEMKEKFDYIFLSPFFDSLSKKGYKSEFNLKDLKLWLNNSSQDIVALGGITRKNLEKISHFNLYGVAVLGYLWENHKTENIYLAFEELKACLQKEQQANLKH